MSSPSISPEPADMPDIDDLQQQIHDLTKLRNSHQAELLSLRSTKTLKDHLSSSSSTPLKTTISPSLEISDKNLNDILLKRSAELTKDQQEWTQEALYRMTGLTKFSITDPSLKPNGTGTNTTELTGIRVEVMADGKFGTPYYLFLKPYDVTPKPTPEDPSPTESASETHLTLHRHTIPAYFIQNLNTLAEKYLPPPPRMQNLDRFARDVRHFLVLHHLRKSRLIRIKDQVTQNLPESHPTPEDVPDIYVSEFTVDPEARLVEVEWRDIDNMDSKRLGWIALTQEGGIEGLIVKENGQRILHMEMQIKGDWVRGGADSMDWVTGLFERLQWTDSTGAY
ncbi:hypothetical protein TWF281_002580 [Arthrobotrys megalospora]